MADLEDGFVELDDTNALRGWTVSNLHSFKPAHFNTITSCEHCGGVIVALQWNQGMTCTECGFNAHIQCASAVPPNCIGADPPKTYEDKIPDKDFMHQHTFYERFFEKPTFCNVCRHILIKVGKQGYRCSVCGFIAHPGCVHKAPPSCATTMVSAPKGEKFEHFWIEGNLTGNCSICNTNLSKLTVIFGYRCFWCRRQVCSTCYAAQVYSDICDLGALKEIILPPTAIIAPDPNNIDTWTIQPPPGTKPLIAFINRKSGGQLGELIIRRLNEQLNPAQVVDLSKGGPRPMLSCLKRCNVKDFQILACGGDGTVAWVLQTLDELQLDPMPPVAVMPLGTGNDLARTLGWGGGYAKEDIATILKEIMDGEHVLVDRWALTVTSATGQSVTKYLNNYFSIGCDAQIALEFHRQREENPAAFSNGTINQMRYVALSVRKLINPLPDLSTCLTVYVDDKKLDLPSIEELLIINLPSYMKGTDAWGDVATDPWRPQQIDDKLIEVVGITSALHLAQLQAGANTGIRLAQARKIKIICNQADLTLPLQLDGEPWEETGPTVEITWHNQAPMIKKRGSSVCRPLLLAKRG